MALVALVPGANVGPTDTMAGCLWDTGTSVVTDEATTVVRPSGNDSRTIFKPRKGMLGVEKAVVTGLARVALVRSGRGRSLVRASLDHCVGYALHHSAEGDCQHRRSQRSVSQPFSRKWQQVSGS